MDTKTIFEQMAHKYDTDERMVGAKAIAEKIRSELTNTKEKTAMDYGCGTGLVGLELAESFRSMLFVDASPQMIEQVKMKIARLGVRNAKTLVADFAAAPSSGIKADYVVLSQVLLHVKEYRGLLRTLHTMLKEEGHLILVDFDKNENIVSDLVHPGFDQTELRGLLKEIGFQRVRSETFYRGERMFMKQDASLFFLDAAR